MKAILTGALLALATTTTGAAENKDSVDYLLPYCKLVPNGPYVHMVDAFEAGRCAGIVQTVAVWLDENRAKGRAQSDPTFCADIPNGVNNGQLLRVV
jgi:hypothetical protein